MSYIIKHDFNQEIPYYVRLVNDKEFEEIYNPKFATQFDTQKAAMTWVNRSSSMSKYSKIVDAESAIQEYENWVNSGSVRRTLACINQTMSRPYNNETVDEVIDWWLYQRENDDEIKYEHYETWPKLYSITKHLWDVESHHNREYTELFHTFQIFTNRDGNFTDFEKEINKVLNKVTYKNEDGYLIFPIFDHFLSEYGNSVSLLIHPDTKQVKIKGSYLWDKKEFSSLEDAFEYMKQERYYE